MLRPQRKKRDPDKPARRRKPPVSLSDEQLLALLQTARRHRERDYVMILVTYWHGLRASETVDLRESDIDLADGKILVRRGKGSEGGWWPLQEWGDNPLFDERVAIAGWLANRERFGLKGGAKPAAKIRHSTKNVRFSPPAGVERPPAVEKPAGGPGPSPRTSKASSGQGNDGGGHPGGETGAPAGPIGQNPDSRLFPINRGQFWNLVHCHALEAGIPRRKCKPHMLKHSIAKHLVGQGVATNEIQEWIGWRSIETLNWYTRADEEELGQRIGDAIRGKSGLRQMQQGVLFPGFSGRTR